MHKSNFTYLDNHSTTPLDPMVLEAMLPFFTTHFHNSFGDHLANKMVNGAISEAREKIGALISCSPANIFFTAGATESINWALRSLAENLPADRRHIVTSAIEHSAVIETCKFLEREMNVKVSRVSPDGDGIISLAAIQSVITEQTGMIVIMHANNEIGTIQPISEIGEFAHSKGIYLFIDAAQSVGTVAIEMKKWNADLLCGSGHKIYGPKGTGFLAVSDKGKMALSPLIRGGGQENGFRSGTLNVPGIVGMGEAARIIKSTQPAEVAEITRLRNMLLDLLRADIPTLVVNGSMNSRLPGNLNFSIPGITGDIAIKNIDGFIFSKGSACNSAKKQLSHVLKSITNDSDVIEGAIRIGIGRFNKEADITEFASAVHQLVKSMAAANIQLHH